MAAAPAVLKGAPQRPPNVLFITADDLGPMLSCHGERRIQTPHMDRLAARGVRFTTAYISQASCSPSRSSMFTGIYPHGNGQYGLANGGFTLHPPLRQATIPALLKQKGYRTGIIGKLHVEPESTFPFDYSERNTMNTRKVRDVAAKAGAFFNESKGQPFFLMVNYSDPHAFRRENDRNAWYFPPQVDGLPERPLSPGPATVWNFQQIDTPEQRERVANYLNAVLRLDAGIGMLMDAFDKAGLQENTVIVFVGDHGPPFCRSKTTCYEAALRVPFFVRWPGVSRQMTSPAMVSTVDILPTILDAAGLPVPGNVHGRSLRPALEDPKAPWREYLAAEFHCHGANIFYPRRAIRDGRYKLIHNLRAGQMKPSNSIDGDPAYRISQEPRYAGTPIRRAFDTFADPPEFELYDLERDPVEFHNLAGKPETRAVEERMKQAMDRWREETADPFRDPAFMEKAARPRG